jgi:putative adenylate-forming enzyme
MTKLGGALSELVRGNADWEAFSFPTFYLGCRTRFSRMQSDELRRYQMRKAQNIVRYARRHAPFFDELYQGHDTADVWSLPTVDKPIMMANLTTYNTLGLDRQEILGFCLRVEKTRNFGVRLKGASVAMSSGTSGNKGVEIITPREESTLRAAFLARFPFPRAKINMAFILRVSSPALRIDVLGHRLTYVSQLNTLEEIRGQVQRIDPNVLAGPPSMLRILAREAELGRLDIAPSQLVSYAEVLYPEDRARLSDVFKCPVFEIYKATEGAIAISCRHGNLHINEDLVAVELLNADGTPTPPGTPSHHVLVTDLHKTSQPIIRYRLNDILTIEPAECPCGSAFRVIRQIQGRSDDVFWGTPVRGGEMQFIFPDYIRRAIIALSDHIDEYQVIQESPDAVLARLQVHDDAEQQRIAEAAREAIRRVFAEYGCHPPRVEVEFGAPVPNPRSLKLIRIHRAFEPGF